MRYNNIKNGFLTDLTKKENVYLLGLFWADAYINLKTLNGSFSCIKKDSDCPKKIFPDSFEYKTFL